MTSTPKKVAVVVAHGMGEQVPMETLRAFVDAAWVTDRKAQWDAPGDERADAIWVKPDKLTHSLELRRITTRATRKIPSDPKSKGDRLDFFEFYWADLAEGTTVEETWDWIRTLLWRPFRRVPKGLFGAWASLWIAALAFILLLALPYLPILPDTWNTGWTKALFAALAAIAAYVLHSLVAPYAGDVARYVRADPRNIGIRRAIRERGLTLLEDLHTCGQYERIIVVAHSLGTIIAYDLISFFWATRRDAIAFAEGEASYKALRAVEAAGHRLDRAFGPGIDVERTAFREAQRELRRTLRNDDAGRQRDPKKSEEWLISDFVTLGSPLTHAKFLLARDDDEFAAMIATMRFPTNPPAGEPVEAEQMSKIAADGAASLKEPGLRDPRGLFSFYQPVKTWIAHHAAPFAPVRWTNVYDPFGPIWAGDVISGPLAPTFGRGIKDIDLRALRGRQSRGFTHTKYWSMAEGPDAPHLDALRKAIDLLDLPDSEIWG